MLTVDDIREIDLSACEHDYPPPNSPALHNIGEIMNVAREIFPYDGLMNSAEGGVAVIWARSNGYADIECLNDGSIVAVTSRPGHREGDLEVWDVTDARGAVEKIKRFFGDS